GLKRAEMLSQAQIHDIEDLLKYKPFRYEDRTRFRKIAELEPDKEVVIEGQVTVTGRYTTPMKRMRIFEMVVKDESGSLPVKFFNQPYLGRVFQKGQSVILYGIPRVDSYTSGIAMLNPEYEIIDGGTDEKLHTGRIVPVYRRIGRLTSRMLRQIIFQLLGDLPQTLKDPLPESVLRKYKFPDRKKAFQEIHFPSSRGVVSETYLQELELNQTPSQQRFIFEEFFLFQLGLQLIREKRERVPKSRLIQMSKGLKKIIDSILPFEPTSAQKRVLEQIVGDLCSLKLMNRLLQGDVGSGKTIVALQAMILVIENGYQAALMVPTEILAEQHCQTVGQFLNDTRYQIAFLTSSVKGKKRELVLRQIRAGEIDLLIGTHALIQEGVEFKNLGLVVIDEQHRFGVQQRSQLIKKGDQPETLVMTATPIPRSLALTLYGDLDVSILDELPPGRPEVKTILRGEHNRQEVYATLLSELQKGRQAFVVYPLIEESEKVDLRAATEMAEHWQREVFPDFTVVLIHGRLKTEEKGALMQRFKDGQIHVLVSTTVIEVGIDVPNATLMVVEHSERFGLSQLHQLRGRIGRGKHPGLCILMMGESSSSQANQRLDIMCETRDGFKIAEKDLEIRGPGEFVGTRQSGIPQFVFGDLVRDRRHLELAREEAKEYLRHCLESSSVPPRQALSKFAAWWKEHYALYNVG
ncbi:ATP-dependent DNA helicase RecG, partial [Acidobacteria bacterium AH-259-D05]|nr:ATP-dependent DNA helicase RecG [Acidobacteria bacterium AH-259-D05]